jgi:hypothetical protein
LDAYKDVLMKMDYRCALLAAEEQVETNRQGISSAIFPPVDDFSIRSIKENTI